MATYNELFDLRRQNTDLKNRVTVAVTIKAQSLLDLATPTANQIQWAVSAIDNPGQAADRLLNYVLAKHSGLTVQQISGATDSAIQTAVNGAVDAIIAAGVV